MSLIILHKESTPKLQKPERHKSRQMETENFQIKLKKQWRKELGFVHGVLDKFYSKLDFNSLI